MRFSAMRKAFTCSGVRWSARITGTWASPSFLAAENSTVAGYDDVVAIDDDRNQMADRRDDAGQPINLTFAVIARVAFVGNQYSDRQKLDL